MEQWTFECVTQKSAKQVWSKTWKCTHKQFQNKMCEFRCCCTFYVVYLWRVRELVQLFRNSSEWITNVTVSCNFWKLLAVDGWTYTTHNISSKLLELSLLTTLKHRTSFFPSYPQIVGAHRIPCNRIGFCETRYFLIIWVYVFTYGPLCSIDFSDKIIGYWIAFSQDVLMKF